MATSRHNCDNGTEFVNYEVIETQGIEWELTVPYTPQVNGVAERMNRVIKDKARCMLLGSSLSKKLLIEAVLYGMDSSYNYC